MATVKELKAYLETIPEDTEVYVSVHEYHGWDSYSSFRDLDLHPYDGNVDRSTSCLYLGQC